MTKFLLNSLVGFRAVVLFTLLIGAGYPVAVWATAQTIASEQANGSIVYLDGKPVGSRLLAQNFNGDPKWLWPRDSAAGKEGYDGAASGGTNLGPNSEKLLRQIENRKKIFGDNAPPEALTASASGLDPDISPEWAKMQLQRIADSRGIELAKVQSCVDQASRGRQWGFLGQPRVNVIETNLCLAKLK